MIDLKVACFNRTFMELKCNSCDNIKQDFASFNRTFMELKWIINMHLRRSRSVLIVPLWN